MKSHREMGQVTVVVPAKLRLVQVLDHEVSLGFFPLPGLPGDWRETLRS